ncbi:succinyl-CoA synthetase subunit beta [Marinobacteraceae bacterium S3BR75-40.1]
MNKALPYPLYRLAGWLLLAFIAPLFFVGGPDWASGLLFKSAWNLGHILFFGLLTWMVRPWRWVAGWRLWLGVTLVVLAAGALIESFQHAFNLDVEWHDMLRNLIGSWLVLAWAPRRGVSARSRGVGRGLRSVTTLLLLYELALVGMVAFQQWQVAHQLPLVYDFSQEQPADFWHGSVTASTEHATTGTYSLRIALGTENYSGISLYNLPEDWTGYRYLDLRFFLPDKTALSITLRVNDRRHDRGTGAYSDRFNTRLELHPGSNHIRIPLKAVAEAPANRPMDMDDIRRLGLFTTSLEQPRTLYLQGIELN